MHFSIKISHSDVTDMVQLLRLLHEANLSSIYAVIATYIFEVELIYYHVPLTLFK